MTRNTIKEVVHPDLCLIAENLSPYFISTVGYLPRATHLKDPPDYLPPFIDPKEWTLEAATFGQNDYIGMLMARDVSEIALQ